MAKIFITNPGQEFREMQLLAEPIDQSGPVYEITREKAQTMLGFGAAMTDSSAVVIKRLPEEKRQQLIHEIYSPEETGFNVTRICVGSSDYADSIYDFAPVADDMQMEHFDCSHDDENIIPILQMARKENPDLYLYSSPWSPPGWMTTNGIMQGGFMRYECVDAYVLYYLKFIQYYKDHGLQLNALTTQNETETDQTSRMPACYWHPDTEAEFAVKMRKALNENGFEDLDIWLMDHNFDLWRRVLYQLSDEEVRRAASGVAWHPYGGHPEAVRWVGNRYPQMGHHWTEGWYIPAAARNDGDNFVTSYTVTKGYATCARGFLQAINNGIQSITVWNIVLDEDGAPNVGPFNCRGTIEINRGSGQIKRSHEYYALAHFSKFVKRGAKRLVVNPIMMPDNFDAAAFENPDGSVVMIVANTDHYDSPLGFSYRGKTYYTWVKRQSVNTIVFD